MAKKIIWVIAAAVLIAAAGITFNKFSAGVEEQAASSVKQAVVESVVQCCAIEGYYPPDVEYLEENYGLSIDHGKYIVTYDMFASNIMPDITVIVK